MHIFAKKINFAAIMKCHFLVRRLVMLLTGVAAACGAVCAQVPFDRGLKEPVTFVEKGQWITGISVNYSATSQDNYHFFIFEGINGKSYSFKVSPMLMFSFKDNMAAGGRFSYSRSMVKMDSGSLKLSSDLSIFDADHLYSINHNYSMTGAFRNYISLGGSNRFGIFNEIQLQIGGGQSKLANGSGDALSGSYLTNFNVSLGLTPGFIMFLNNYSALEVNVGVLGFNYVHSRSVTDQIYVANLNSNSANFKINLFSITFGVAFYL